ncbi:MAG: MBL fold metallo-hydrolase [Actinoplanes sp.]
MSHIISVGEFTVTALADGASYLPPLFYPGADFSAEPHLLDADGTFHIRCGAFLIQGGARTILVDAGVGPTRMPFPADLTAAAGLTDPPEFLVSGGGLPDSLAAAGVDPAAVTAVVLTHLHLDHIGWVAPEGKPFFPHAEVYYGAADWAALITPAAPDDPARIIMETAAAAGILRPLDAPAVEIVPGIVARHTPGHTPGSYVVSVSSQGERALLTGDVIQHPGQLTDAGISFLNDVDIAQATRARAGLLTGVAGQDVTLATAHLDQPIFRRVTADNRWVAAPE